MNYNPEQLRAILVYCSELNRIDKDANVRNSGISLGVSLAVQENHQIVGRLKKDSQGWNFEPFSSDLSSAITNAVYRETGDDPGRMTNISITHHIGEPARVMAEFCLQR